MSVRPRSLSQRKHQLNRGATELRNTGCKERGPAKSTRTDTLVRVEMRRRMLLMRHHCTLHTRSH